MNTKKTMGLFAVAAMIAGAVPLAARAAGDIRSIDVVNNYVWTNGVTTAKAYPNAASPLVAGETVAFRFRLMNHEWQKTYADPSYTNTWKLSYKGIGSEAYDAVYKPLMVALWVSDHVKFAPVVLEVPQDTDGAYKASAHYTDLVAVYTVGAGDLALPMKLANESWTGEALTGDSARYKFANDDCWEIRDAQTGLEVCEFYFGPTNASDPEHPDWNTYRKFEHNRDYDLSMAGIHVQAVDFADGWYDEAQGVWRGIALNTTTAEPSSPAIAIPGGASESFDLYVWTEDEGVVRAATDNVVGGKRVLKVHVTAKDTDVKFRLEGVSTNEPATTTVYLSQFPTNCYNGSGVLITNFLTRTVRCTPPPAPSVTLSLGAGMDATAEVTTGTDYAKNAIQLNVVLSKAYTEDLKVHLGPMLAGHGGVIDSSEDVYKQRIIAISPDEDSTSWLNRTPEEMDVVTFAPGELKKTLYVYALGATTNSAAWEKGVKFQPTIEPAAATSFYYGGVKGCTLRVRGIPPEIAYPAEGEAITPFTGTSPVTMTLKLKDSYRNVNLNDLADLGRYTIVWDCGVGFPDTPARQTTFANVAPDSVANGVATFKLSVTHYAAENTYPTVVTVINPEGEESTVHFTVTTKAPASANATVGDGTGNYFCEDSENAVNVKINLEADFNYGAELFAYLIPVNADASNYVSSAYFAYDENGNPNNQKGIPIPNGSKSSASVPALYLNDGVQPYANPQFDIVIVTSNGKFDPTKVVDQYQSTSFNLFVTNRPPKATAITSGTEWENGAVCSPVPESANKVYKVVPRNIDDTLPDRDATNTAANAHLSLVTRWQFFSPEGLLLDTHYRFGADSNQVEYAFGNLGTNRIEVCMLDKDMRSQGDVKADASDDSGWNDDAVKKWGPPCILLVPVTDQPYVEITTVDGKSQYNETDEIELQVNLVGQFPNHKINVQIQVEKRNESEWGSDGGFLELDTYDVEVQKNKYLASQTILVKAMDGTAMSKKYGYTITAAVTNHVQNNQKVYYDELYMKGSTRVTVVNVAPEIVLPEEITQSNAVNVAMNSWVSNKWNVGDVDADLKNTQFAVEWMTDEGDSKIFYSTGTKESIMTGEWGTQFASAGYHWINMTVKDKDGASTSVRRYYYVSPSKSVFLYPHGPHDTPLTDVSQRYLSAGGLGEGTTRAEGSLSGLVNFRQQWNWGPTVASATYYAKGFKVGEKDPLANAVGEKSEGGDDAYAYPDPELDSFFYAWIVNTSDESGGSYTASAIIATPLLKPYPTAEGSTPLPEFDAEAVSYADVRVEAIFSKELYPADNMGDLNCDGIPDYWALKQWGNGRLFEGAAGGDGSESGGSLDLLASGGADLKSMASYNDDFDFLPLAYTSGNPINPPKPGWGVLSADGVASAGNSAFGVAFNAKLEIRGIGEGLNEPGISDQDFTEAETFALMADYFASHAATEDPAADREAAFAWAKTTGWNCERRLDPTKDDTDEDLFPDGWEYFFWYYAKAGALVPDDKGNLQWRRLTGRRLPFITAQNVGLLVSGEPISSEEIAEAFDPLKAGDPSRDFDGDGLLDLEEVLLGTNPVDFDSDGDGIPDSLEVYYGTDPLDPIDADALDTLKRANPDGDFMARAETAPEYFRATYADGSVYAFPRGQVASVVFEAREPEITKGWYVKAKGSGEIYVVSGEELDGDVMPVVDECLMKTVKARKVLDASDFADINGLVQLPEGATEFLGEEVVLEAGLALAMDDTAAFDGDEWSALKMTVNLAQDGGEPVPAAKGLELFKYGIGADAPWVPCTKDVKGFWQTKNLPDETKTPCVVDFECDAALTLIHNQVFNYFGFDPRTGWMRDDYGYVAARWHNDNSEKVSGVGEAGLAVNTAPYTTLDEFLVAIYRIKVPNLRARDLWIDVEEQNNIQSATLSALVSLTTCPKNMAAAPDEEGEEDEFVASAQTTSGNTTNLASKRLKDIKGDKYGADTDYDGIPDGWELYVDANPNWGDDAWLVDGYEDRENGDDGLTYLQEYAGTDSCNAYSNVPSIYQNHPGKNSGWYNKFFPTNPYDGDTDGDGLADNKEGLGWTTTFYVGNNEYKRTPFSFIYGKNEDGDRPAEDADDFKKTCIRGGGLNPCAVDTDGDLLPDPWEYEFAGVRVAPASGNSSNAWDVAFSPIEGSGIDATTFARDIKNICAADGLQLAMGDNVELRGGMDGTWSGDHSLDFDHDGLRNYQEYLVQSLRHLRYDDCETPLMGRYISDFSTVPVQEKYVKKGTKPVFLPMQTWDGAAFFQQAKVQGFNSASAWNFRLLGYFARAPHEWDPLNCNTAGQSGCKNYADFEGAGYRVMLRPKGLYMSAVGWAHLDGGMGGYYVGDVCFYASTDPRRWDSDADGMDDRYELFHGLNPLLGSAADPAAGDVEPNWVKYDRIAAIYGGSITAWNNAWTGWNAQKFAANPTEMFDAMKYPWMLGTAEADADGDGLRNAEEALIVNITDPQPRHTDPTPLWMTDSTIANKASFTAQYYRYDPTLGASTLADVRAFPWATSRNTVYTGNRLELDGSNMDFMFAFEENEGYDTDHDGLADGAELVKAVSDASDPLKFTDPDRRQAMYFPGWDGEKGSAAVSCNGSLQRPYSLAYDLLRQFTVECWVKPESEADAVIVERIADYGASTLSNNVSALRANFRIGIENGQYYAEYDGTTGAGNMGDAGTSRVKGPKADTNAWTHLAFTYDGSTLALYADGNENPWDVNRNVSLVPANGITVLNQEAGTLQTSFPVKEYGYSALPCALIVGAHAVKANVLTLEKQNPLDRVSWQSFDVARFFKGYVDEVRVWDGARSGLEISENYMRRYSFADVAANRDAVFAAWRPVEETSGAGAVFGTRNNNDGHRTLPCELVQHVNFATLPGAVADADAARAYAVMQEPIGFSDNVNGNVRWNGKGVDLSCGWWDDLDVASYVYWNRCLVPWIPNTVAHLPQLDGSAVDSEYWSADFAGLNAAAAVNAAGANLFPNSANPYPYYLYTFDRLDHLLRIGEIGFNNGQAPYADENVPNAYDERNAPIAARYWQAYFQLRSGFVGTSDLVPLGTAFAKRTPAMWDGKGAAAAWETTGTEENGGKFCDADNDNIPDWWEKRVAEKTDAYTAADGAPLDPATLVWSTPVKYNGVVMTAAEAYRRDLAEGLLPGAEDVELAWRDYVDADDDGLFDWWEKLFGLTDATSLDDTDGDGLSNYAEYLINQCFGLSQSLMSSTLGTAEEPVYSTVDPTLARTFADKGQKVSDYFLKFGRLYLGEMFTDHDFMDDWWERKYATDVLSPFVYDAHKDPDGDGWSNYAECRANTAPDLQVSVGALGETVAEYPVPTIRATFVYRRGKFNDAKAEEPTPIVVRAYSAKNELLDRPDATWTITTGATVTKQLGKNFPRTAKTTLGPSMVAPGTIKVDFCPTTWQSISSGVVTFHHLDTWVSVFVDRPRADNNAKGDLVYTFDEDMVIGTVDYQTGEVEIDLAKTAEFTHVEGDSSTQQIYPLYGAYVRTSWTSVIPTGANQVQFALTDADVGSGHVKEGKNLFEVFLDQDSSGTYTPGEPYGVISDVDVGWQETAPFTVELTETAPQIFRLDLAAAVENNDYDSQSELNDRGVRGYAATNCGATAGVDMPKPTAETRLRIVRSEINGLAGRKTSTSTFYPVATVLDQKADLSLSPLVTERNLLVAGLRDLDWGALEAPAQSLGISYANVTRVGYRVVLGDGSVSPTETNNNLATMFVNVFEPGVAGAQTKAAPVAPSGDLYANQATFSWRHVCDLKDYPAFRLRVWKDKAMQQLVYDSGAQPAPARDANGLYNFAAPIYAESVTPNGVYFSATNNYFWSVSMLDAKFTTPNTTETPMEFRLNCSGAGGGLAAEGRINVKVKYLGPAPVAKPNQLAGLVRVQAFTSKDFAGKPAGEGCVMDLGWCNDAEFAADGLAALTNETTLAVNAIVRGVPCGTTSDPAVYYVRAFLDSNGNGVCDAWESWGYARCKNEDTGSVFEPKGCQVKAGTSSMPTVEVYLEDRDVDADGLPDAWEMVSLGGLDVRTSPTGPTFFTHVNRKLLEKLDWAPKMVNAAYADAVGGSTVESYPVYMLLSSPRTAAALVDSPAAVTDADGVKITSFSAEGGIAFEVETDTTVVNPDGKSNLLKATVSADDEVELVWTLYRADSLDGEFVEVKSGTLAGVSACGKAKFTAADLAEMNAAVKADAEERGQGFYKVGVRVK